jgi:hypothetical protein
MNEQNLMTVQAKKNFPTKNTLNQFKDPGFFYGTTYHTHSSGPVEVPEKVAKQLIKDGIADAVAFMPKTEKAVERKLEAQRR